MSAAAPANDARPLRIGLLSFAHYHANFWSEVFVARGVLAGIWDDDPVRGREAAARFDTRYHDDVEALLAHCTAVAICSETVAHPELAARAARHGCALLCEKPLGIDVAACEQIAHTVRESGVTFMQSFPKRFDPVSHYLREQVQAGALGRITLVRIRHGHHYGLLDDFRTRWYVDPARSGGGALLDEGVHGADLLAWLFGMPAGVTAVTSNAALGLAVEDLGIATFMFESGMLAELTASFTFAAADASIELYGTRGTLLVAGVDLASRDITHEGFVRVYRSDQSERRWQVVPLTPRFKQGEFHQQNAHAFVDCLEQVTPPPITVEDGLRASKMIAAAYRAAETGQRQVIEP
ncbi:MAG: Gfo/Idh/MocA family oxidoreductase [Betaproteobacteria bacterium]